jgi:hypothetical protein
VSRLLDELQRLQYAGEGQRAVAIGFNAHV